MSDKQQILEVYLKEYEKLKEEQAQRIGFRDNMLYVTLGVFGGILSFALTAKTNYYALLVIPDEITFVLSGVVALLAFWFLVSEPSLAIHILCWIELVLLLILGVEIVIYADLATGR